MSRPNHRSTWPLLCILACLFILSAVAPRSWDRAKSPLPSTDEILNYGQTDVARDAAKPLAATQDTAPVASRVVPTVQYELLPLVRTPITEGALRGLALPPIAGAAGAASVAEAPVPAAEAVTEEDLSAVADDESESEQPMAAEAPTATPTAQDQAVEDLPPIDPQLVEDSIDQQPGEDVATDQGSTPIAPSAATTPTSVADAMEDGMAEDSAAQPAADTAAPGPEGSADDTASLDDMPSDDATTMSDTPADDTAAVEVAPEPKLESQANLDEQPQAGKELKTVPSTVWPFPESLYERLEGVAYECETGSWALEAESLVRRLGMAMWKSPGRVPELLDRLQHLVSEANPLSDSLPDADLAREVRRAAHALNRRVELWKQATTLLSPREAAELLGHVERFESEALHADGRPLAEAARKYQSAADPAMRDLGLWLEAYYRNANLRVMISQALMNRFIPAPPDEYGQVNETILGLPVRGRSLTSSEISLRYVPDPQRLRMAFMVMGQVAALTASTAGPATIVSGSESYYVARKEMQVMADGIWLGSAEVSVRNHMQLRSVETAFDWIPLVGTVAQSVTRSQVELNQPAVSREVEQKISQTARQRIDDEAYAKLDTAVSKLRQRVFAPLAAMSLDPNMISAETTSERMTTRIRLAGDDQVGGHTPRPRAPADSLLSIQVHETALNNALQRLELDGRTFSLPALSKHVAAKLARPEAWKTNPDHDDVTISFAPHDAVSVRLRDGLFTIDLAIAQLSKGDYVWPDFKVRVVYRPEVHGRAVDLVRDGIIELISEGLGNRGQIAVRGIFSTTFAKNRPLHLVPQSMVDDKRLADLAVTQMEIEDGWLGLALAPDRRAAAPTTLR